jgi:hypothetical protein
MSRPVAIGSQYGAAEMKTGATSPMTLGNMRANGVHGIAVWRLGRGCD